MAKIIDAICQNGIIKPLENIELDENEYLKIIILRVNNQYKAKKKETLYGYFPQLKKLSEKDIESGKKIWERGVEGELKILQR